MKTKLIILLISCCVASSLRMNAQDSTQKLLEQAQVEAKRTGKKIFVKFEASWCGWCHRMTKNMKAPLTKKLFEENFILVPIVVKESEKNKKLENPGGEELIKKYNHGNSSVGLPFWFVLDANLNKIEDSYNNKNQNLGCPASPEEVTVFIKKLQHIIPSFSAKDAAKIKTQFTLKK